MNLRHLEVFHAIMTSSSLTEASARLNISQPAVSSMLKHMESQLGFQLFKRMGGRLHPTPEADVMFEDVDGIFKHVATVRRMATNLRDARTGTVTIVAAPTLADAILPYAVDEFRKTRPNVSIQIRSLPTSQVAERIARREADIGLAYGISQKATGTDFQAIGKSRVCCVMRPSHPLADHAKIGPNELSGHPIISYEANTPFGRLIEDCFRSHGKTSGVTVEVSISLTACFVADRGDMLALVDEIMPRSGAFPNLLTRAFEPKLETEIALLFPSDRPRSRLANQFAEVLSNVTGKLMDEETTL